MAKKRKNGDTPSADARILKTASKSVRDVVPSEDEIRVRAYEIYVASGYIPGRDLENWVQAEQEIAAKR